MSQSYEKREREIEHLRTELAKEKARYKQLWKINCHQLSTHEDELSEKDAQISNIQESIEEGIGREGTESSGAVVRAFSDERRLLPRTERRPAPDTRLTLNTLAQLLWVKGGAGLHQ